MDMTAPDTTRKSSATFSIEGLQSDLNKQMDNPDLGVHVCEGCGTNFETRRGLSSHARSHLRQLGVAVSDSSGAPIDLLCQLIKERGGTLPKLKTQPSTVKKSKHKSPSIKKNTGPKLKIKISNLVKKKYAISSSSSTAVKGSVKSGPRSSPMAVAKPHKASSRGTAVSTPSSFSSPYKAVESRLSDASPSTTSSLAIAKPLWAPQETDAPLNLTTMMNSIARDDVHVCELCGAWYETRKGLSSHARAHLRQFGVNLDSKGAPIEVLHKIIQSEEFQEKATAGQLEGLSVFEDYTSPSSTPSTSSAISKNPSLSPVSSKGLISMNPTPPPKKKQKISPDVSESLSLGRKTELKLPTPTKKNKSSPDVSGSMTLSGKAALKLPSSTKNQKTTPDVLGSMTLGGKAELKSPTPTKKQKSSPDVSGSMTLCGKAEPKSPTPTKKKKSSPDVSGNMTLSGKAALKLPSSTKKQKTTTDASESMTLGGKTELKSSTTTKRQKSSPDDSGSMTLSGNEEIKSPSQGESSKDVKCEFCHEKFKKSQSLASHARYHLRQLGITEWTVRGSPMATLREVMACRDAPAGSHKALGSPSLPPPACTSVPPTVPYLPSSPKPITQSSSSPPVPHKVPKARKGYRTVVPTPKDEPMEVDVSILESPKPRSTPAIPLPPHNVSSPTTVKPLVTAPKHEQQDSTQFVCCDYCGEMFDTRKAFSCHARGHLRQLGVKWSLKVPPIKALYELMRREGTEKASAVKPEHGVGAAVQWKKPTSSPCTVTPSPEKTASDNMTTSCDATCELCGFDFENRKALASHVRAHLRQQGVDWKIIGSPIETLTAWMQSEPEKVAELHKRYMQGHLPFVKKGSRRSSSSPHLSSDSEDVRLGSQKASSAARVSAVQPQVSQLSKGSMGVAPAREGKAGMSHSSSSQHRKRPSQSEAPLSSDSLIQTPTARSEFAVRSPRGCERRPPKHSSHRESISGETEPSKPSRAGNIPSLVPRPPETSLVKLVGKVYSLKCRFCEEVFEGPLSIQEDWVMHLQQHILKLKKNSTSSPQSSESRGPVQSPLTHTEAPLLIGPQAM
ncbi:protein Wiz isoform X2 [Myxocyprinus asiaticus]|uniref:protein Wiz isoform X2 n=1 Tax=Myxocyprinus asiaticus TaxID=70543 RepID=UPI0022223225|nr:protein Wiz isoform X2 [Myxocyprinus asiaticus]